MQVNVDRASRERELEAAARTALELRGGRKFSEAEWAAMRAQLVEFARILRSWDAGHDGSMTR